MNWPAEAAQRAVHRRSPTARPPSIAGFTLLELLVVFALLGLAIGATFLSVNPHEPGAAARRAAARLALRLDLARVLATSHGTRVDWQADANGGSFALGGDREGEGAGQASAPPGFVRLGLRPIVLPPGYRLRLRRGAATGDTLSFFADGRYDRAEVLVEGVEGPVARIELAGFGPVRLGEAPAWPASAAIATTPGGR